LYEFLFRLNEKLCFSSWFGAVRFSFSSVVLDLINSTAPLFNLSCADFTGSFQLPSLEHYFFFFFHLTLGKQVLISGSVACGQDAVFRVPVLGLAVTKCSAPFFSFQRKIFTALQPSLGSERPDRWIRLCSDCFAALICSSARPHQSFFSSQ
jgi:hypothetical protein